MDSVIVQNKRLSGIVAPLYTKWLKKDNAFLTSVCLRFIRQDYRVTSLSFLSMWDTGDRFQKLKERKSEINKNMFPNTLVGVERYGGAVT